MKYGMYVLVGCALACQKTTVVRASMTRAVAATQQKYATVSLEKSKRLEKRLKLQVDLGHARTHFIQGIVKYKSECGTLAFENQGYQRLVLGISRYEYAFKKLAFETLAAMPVGTSESQLSEALKESFPTNCPRVLEGVWVEFARQVIRCAFEQYEELIQSVLRYSGIQ